MGTKTDHSKDIERLRTLATLDTYTDSSVIRTAADLLEMHDRQSLSLDEWTNARLMVEKFVGHRIEENHV